MRVRAIAALSIVAVAVAVLIVILGSGDSGSKPAAEEPLPPLRETKPGPTDHPSGAPRHRVEKAIWGPVELPDGSSAFPTYERLGVDVFQIQLRWADVAARRPANPVDPAEPTYEWPPQIDEAIAEARRHGIEIAILVTTTPEWANGGRAEINAPQNPSDFAVFLTAAANRYPEVHDWIIWGEQNRSDRFLPNRPEDPVGPRAYAVLLDVAYRALKSVSQKEVVIGGTIFSGGDVRPPDFLRWLRLPNGRRPRLDWFGLNPYPFRLPDLAGEPVPGGYRDLSDLDTFAAEVRRAYAGSGIDPPLWLSEFTVQSDHDSRYFEFHVSEAEQALWLRRGYEAAEEAGHVKGLGWFTLLDQPPGPGSSEWGLMSADGAPKPAYRAYRSVGGG